MIASASDEPSASWRAARETTDAGPHLGDAWIAYRVAQGAKPAYLTIAATEKHGAIDAVGVAWMQKSRFKLWAKPSARLDLLPCWTRDARARITGDRALENTALARSILELARKSGWSPLEIESFDGPTPPPDLAALGCATRDRYEFLLDLAPATEERLAALKSSHRRKLRDAEKSGVAVADETNGASVELLRELQGHTQERRTSRGEEMELPDPEQYRRLAATFVERGGARLFVGRKDGRALSVILCGVERRRSYYFMGGTSPEGFECNAATLVLWRASVLLAERGVATFNLGGVPRSAEQEGDPQHGLFRFKEGFGGIRVDCRSGRFPASDAP